MAQKIVTICDAHQRTTDDEIPGEAWEVTLSAPGERPTTWAVDLCRDHAKELTDLAATLAAVGRVVDGPRKLRKPAAARVSTPAPASAHTAPNRAPEGSMVPAPCPVCGVVTKNRAALASHLRHVHDGMTIAKAFGEPEPYACPEPGCDFSSARPQGLGAHRRAAHGTPGGAVAS